MRRDYSGDKEQIHEFEQLLQIAAKRSLENYISIEQVETVSRDTFGGRWQPVRTDTTLTRVQGLAEHYAELDQLARQVNSLKRREVDEEDDGQSVAFSYRLREGDKLPELLGTSSPFCNRIEALCHRPGQVLLIVLWKEWKEWAGIDMGRYFDCCEQMLLRNQGLWNGQVRVVAANNPGNTPSRIKDSEGRPAKWHLIEHLQLHKENKTLIDVLDRKISSPSLLLLDKQGRIDCFGGAESISIEKRINELFNGASASKQIIQSKPTNTSADQKWKYFKQLIELPLETTSDCGLKITRTRKYCYGVAQQDTSPLQINHYRPHNTDKCFQFIETLTKGLSSKEFQINGLKYNDSEKNLQTQFRKITNILYENGIKKEPLVLECAQFCPLRQTDWKANKTITLPDIQYRDQCSFLTGFKINQNLRAKGVQINSSSGSFHCEMIGSFWPFRISGTFFRGIYQLKGSDLCQSYCIEQKKGIALLVTVFSSSMLSDQFTKFAQENEKKMQIHLIGGVDYQNKLRICENVFVYGENRGNNDLKVYGFQANSYPLSSYSLLVDCDGRIIKNEKSCKFDQENFLQKQSFQEEQNNIALRSFLESLPTCEQVLRLKEISKNWDYTPSLQFSYSATNPYSNDCAKYIRSAVLSIVIRQKDRHMVDGLAEKFKQFGLKILAYYIQTTDIPMGHKCFDCGELLQLPCYYYAWSKVHRCVSCAEAEDPFQTQHLKRYAVNENAVLIMKPDNNVDTKKLSDNTQPKSQNDRDALTSIQGYGQRCNACQNTCVAMYICLGCNRMPANNSQPVYCKNCAKILRGSDQVQKNRIISRFPSHNEHHPLLRVLFNQTYRR